MGGGDPSDAADNADSAPHGADLVISGNIFTGPTAFQVGDHNVQQNLFMVAPEDLVESAARDLARAVWAQWRNEARARGLFAPALIPVPWKADRIYGDHLRLTGPAPDGHGADMEAFTDAFLAMRQQRLVILGEPGSGKTTLAVMLMITLLKKLRQGDPVPVMLSLSSWDPASAHLDTWLKQQIAANYPDLAPGPLSALIGTQRILPILDGLDELAAAKRPEALRALNRALADRSAVVLTCRTAAYHDAVLHADALRSAAVIQAELLPPETVAGSLADYATGPNAARWQPVLDEVRGNPAGPLAHALSTPLMIWLLRTAYERADTIPGELADNGRYPDARAIEEHLLASLVPAAFPSYPQPDQHAAPRRWPTAKAERWLSYLAHRLVLEHSEDLRWWTIRDLAGQGFLAVMMLLRAVCMLACFAVTGLLLLSTPGDAGGVAGILAAGCMIFAVAVPTEAVEGVMSAKRQKTRGLRSIMPAVQDSRGGAGCLMVAFCVLVGFGVFGTFAVVNVGGVVPDLLAIAAVIGCIVVALVIAGALLRMLMRMSDPGSTPRRSLVVGRARALAFSIGVTLVLAPLISVPAIVGSAFYFGQKAFAENGSPGPFIQASLVIAGGMLLCLLFFSSWGMYVAAHVPLALRGRVPWRLGAFLSDAHRTGVLRQVGSVYQFRHSKLRDSLADQWRRY